MALLESGDKKELGLLYELYSKITFADGLKPIAQRVKIVIIN